MTMGSMGRMGHFSMGTSNNGLGNPDSGRGKQPLDTSTGVRGQSMSSQARYSGAGWGGGVSPLSMGGMGFFASKTK
jgi:hypothetical protein